MIYSRLVSGQGKCPPEDIGGAPGFQEYLNIIAGLPAPAVTGLSRERTLQGLYTHRKYALLFNP